MKKNTSKSYKQRAIESEYNRLRKNLRNRNYRRRKAGKKEIILPKIPKQITERSINKLRKKLGYTTVGESKKGDYNLKEAMDKIALLDRLKELRDDIVTGFYNANIRSALLSYFDEQMHKVQDYNQLKTNYEEHGQRISKVFAIYKTGEQSGSGASLFDALTLLFENTTYWHEFFFDMETGEIFE